jgi:hypothetical protein
MAVGSASEQAGNTAEIGKSDRQGRSLVLQMWGRKARSRRSCRESAFTLNSLRMYRPISGVCSEYDAERINELLADPLFFCVSRGVEHGLKLLLF